jgi:hypothetical protein
LLTRANLQCLHITRYPSAEAQLFPRSGQFSPSLKSSPDLLQEGDPLFGSGMIHIVMSEIIASNPMARHRTHQTFHNPLGRVAKQETDSASGAISADGSELSQLLQIGHYCAVEADVETHSRNEDAVEETLQDRGKPLVPNRIDQDESFRSEQTIGIVLDWRAVQLEADAPSAQRSSIA